MKKILLIPFLLFCFAAISQTKTKLRLPYDTVIVKKPDGTGYLCAAKGIFSDTLFLSKLQYQDGNQSNGYVMTSDADGNISLQPASGNTYTADNGITLTGTNFQWGGTLVQPTTINSSFNDIIFDSVSSELHNYPTDATSLNPFSYTYFAAGSLALNGLPRATSDTIVTIGVNNGAAAINNYAELLARSNAFLSQVRTDLTGVKLTASQISVYNQIGVYYDSISLARPVTGAYDTLNLLIHALPYINSYSRVLMYNPVTGKIAQSTGNGLFWPTSGPFALSGTVTGNNGGHDFTLSGTNYRFYLSDTAGFSSIAGNGTTEKTVILNHSSNAVMSWLNQAETRRNYLLIDSTGASIVLDPGKIFRGNAGDTAFYAGNSYVQKDWVLDHIAGGTTGLYWALSGTSTLTGSATIDAATNNITFSNLSNFTVKTTDYPGGLIAVQNSGNVWLGDGDGDVNGNAIHIDDANNSINFFLGATGTLTYNADGSPYYTSRSLVDSAFVGSVYRGTLDSTQLGYAPKKLLYGSIYAHNSWANLNAFTNVGAGTFSVVANKINASGGASTFTQTLQVSTTDKGTNGNTNLRHWKGYIRAKVTGTGTGFAVGIKSNTINGSYNISGRLVTSTGQSYIEGGFNSGSLFASSASNLSLSVNDYVELSLEQNDYALTMIARNVTTNSAAITTTYTYNIPTDLMHNNGLFSVYNVGGTYTIDSLDFSSKSIVNSDVLVLADSKGDYNATTNFSFPSLLQSNYETTPSAGGFETTADWELRAEEMIQLNPVSVIMCNPSNDGRTSVNTDSTKARYYRLERAFRNAGFQVYHSNGFYETGFSVAPWASYIEATRSADSIIYTFEASAGTAGTGVNGFLAGDNIHPTTAGHQLIYNTIMESFKLKNGKGLPIGNASQQYVQLSPSAQQIGYLNIDGSGGISTIANPFSVGSGTATSSIATVPVRIKTQSNSNLWLYGNSGTNHIYSADNTIGTDLPMDIYASTLDIRVGNTGAIFGMSLNATGDVTFPGKLTAGFNNPGAVTMKITGGTNHTMQYFYNGSTDNLWFSNAGLTGGTAGVITGDGLSLQTVSSGGSQVERFTIASGGNIGIGVGASPTAALQIKAGTATASTSPFKFTAGVVLTSAESGAMETDASNDLFYTNSTAQRARVGMWSYRATATSLTANNADETIVVTATGQTITLPTAVGIQGKHYTIKLTASGSATIATTSSQTIDGSTTYSLASQYKYATVESDNANWVVVANN